MENPDLPIDEEQRLDALRSMRVLDTPVEERFERITRLAKKFFGVPMAAITLVDANRQWFKSGNGLDVRETSRDMSFCAHTILADHLFVIEDTLEDNRFFDNPLVTGAPYIRFYAGVPLHSRNRSRIGTVCLLDTLPHRQGEFDLSVLEDLAALAEHEFRFDSPLNQLPQLELQNGRQPELLDEVTGLWNWDGITRLLEESFHRFRLTGGQQSMAWLHVDYTLPANPSFAALNDVKRHLAVTLLAGLDYRDTAGLVTGGQFLLILDETNREAMITQLAMITDRIRNLFHEFSSTATLHHIRWSALSGTINLHQVAEITEQLEQDLPGYNAPLGSLQLRFEGTLERITLIS